MNSTQLVEKKQPQDFVEYEVKKQMRISNIAKKACDVKFDLSDYLNL